MKYSRGLHIFRRDIRIEDNTALNQALNECGEVIPCFIFTPTQVKNNDYASKNSIQFLIKSLCELNTELESHNSSLSIFYDEIASIFPKIITENKIDAVYINKDYTPFAKKRDAFLREICTKQNISLLEFDDALLTVPGSVLKDDQTPYTIYTPFYNKAIKQEIGEPQNPDTKALSTQNIGETHKAIFTQILPEEKYNKDIRTHGGRKNGLILLDQARNLDDYKTTRDYPSIKGTSLLSAHHKFGTVSIREVYWTMREAIGEDTQFIRELYWRDFATHICHHFPHVFGSAFKTQYANLQWENNKDKFAAWCEGKTGFPIVDAGMRELNETGYMHNRVRMIVASFLTKDLHVDWQWGEKYFAQKLTDYDPSVNNTSWQWAASTGCDAQPYFRIFNPWLQQKRYDANCTYIKQWIPELRNFDAKEIHNLHEQRPLFELEYPKPIVIHKDAKEKALAMFKSLK